MVEFWKKLGLFLGWGLPPGEQEPVVVEEPTVTAAPVEPAPAAWALGFDSVLPDIRGRVAMPVGPGRNVVVSMTAIKVSDMIGAIRYMAEAREQWPFGPDPEGFAGYATVEGPGWDLTVVFKPGWRLEYYAGRSGGGPRVAGEVSWEVLVYALVLAPDYDAVVGYLALNPYRAPYVV